MRRRASTLYNLDWFTVILFLVLITIGWINIYSAEYQEEYSSIFNANQRYGTQFLFMMVAIGIAIIILIIDSKFYSLVPYLVYGFAILLLLIVWKFGVKVKGARSWFQIGGFLFQPAELAKFATSLALAKYISTFSFSLEKFRSWAIVFLIILAPAGLIMLQPDMGSTLVYGALILVLYREGFPGWILVLGIFTATLFIVTLSVDRFLIVIGLVAISYGFFYFLNRRLKNIFISMIIMGVTGALFYLIKKIFHLPIDKYYLALGTLTVSGIILTIISLKKRISHVFLVLVFLFSSIAFTYAVNYMFDNILGNHQRSRMNILLNIESDPLGKGYNVNQSKIAIGSGGITGKGFLQGTQTKFNFVPEQSTDFIFCTIGEEWGFLGSGLLIIFYVTLLLRIIFLAERQRSVFSRVYAYCVFSILFLHFMVNIGMTVGLLPVIGIPLPFVSYGGSSLLSFTLLLFVLLRLDASRVELLR